MAEDITDILRSFTLSSKELQITEVGRDELSSGITECQSSLIGKIVGEKVANYTGVKNFVTTAWGYPKDLTVSELGPNLFQFFMPTKSDRERIAKGGPWILDNQIMVVNRWYEGIEEDDKAFNLAPLWVQVWNLPVHWISKDVGKKIGSVFNQVRDVIIPQTGGKEGRHIKIAALVDIDQPLLRGTIIKVAGGVRWVNFKYERCPDFCYSCMRIGHSGRTYKIEVIVRRGQLDNQYGPWLRAGSGRSSPPKTQPQKNYTDDRTHWTFKNGELIPRPVGRKEVNQNEEHLNVSGQDNRIHKDISTLQVGGEKVTRETDLQGLGMNKPSQDKPNLNNQKESERNVGLQTSLVSHQQAQLEKDRPLYNINKEMPISLMNTPELLISKERKEIGEGGEHKQAEENMQVDENLADMITVASLRKTMRMNKVIKTPVNKRQTLKEGKGQPGNAGQIGKRKFNLKDEEMADADEDELSSKKTKLTEVRIREAAMEVGAEASQIWPLKAI